MLLQHHQNMRIEKQEWRLRSNVDPDRLIISPPHFFVTSSAPGCLTQELIGQLVPKRRSSCGQKEFSRAAGTIDSMVQQYCCNTVAIRSLGSCDTRIAKLTESHSKRESVNEWIKTSSTTFQAPMCQGHKVISPSHFVNPSAPTCL